MSLRYTKRRFPDYAFVPAYFPHPKVDEKGHSYNQAEKVFIPLEAGNYLNSEDYLYGIDLFNHGYYWEAHEVWEGLWKALDKIGTTADFLKALIRFSASGVKVRQGQLSGIQQHAGFAHNFFKNLQDDLKVSHYCGLELKKLIAFTSLVKDKAETLQANPKVNKVEVVFPFILEIK